MIECEFKECIKETVRLDYQKLRAKGLEEPHVFSDQFEKNMEELNRYVSSRIKMKWYMFQRKLKYSCKHARSNMQYEKYKLAYNYIKEIHLTETEIEQINVLVHMKKQELLRE